MVILPVEKLEGPSNRDPSYIVRNGALIETYKEISVIQFLLEELSKHFMHNKYEQQPPNLLQNKDYK